MTTTCNYLPLNITLKIIISNECDAYQRLLSYFKLSCLEIEKQYHVSITQFNLFYISYVCELLTFLFTRILRESCKRRNPQNLVANVDTVC